MSGRRALFLLGVTALVSACAVVRTITGRTVTGTCEGACDHYVTCKPGAGSRDHAACLEECPQVFSDRESIGAYESLSCADAVSYVDGDPIASADRAPRAGASGRTGAGEPLR